VTWPHSTWRTPVPNEINMKKKEAY
jgi:hypothetical protein